jgi:hypothetical protein
MTGQLERELERTLAGAAEGAPRPGPGLVAAVRYRRRRRRHRRAMVVAGACAVALVAMGATVVLRPEPRTAPAARPQWSGTVPDIDGAKPIEEVWPRAVRSLPATLPDGRGYSVHALLGDDRYLVLPKAYGVWTARLSVYDAGAGTATPLAGVPELPTPKPIPPDPGPMNPRRTTFLGTAAGRVVWAIETDHESVPADVEVWSVRLDGEGRARRLARLDAPGRGNTTAGAVRDDAAYLIQVSYDGTGRDVTAHTAVHRIPLDGGEVHSLIGVDRLWPNQGDPAWLRTTGDDVELGLPLRGELWNVVTGERIPWRAARDVTRLRLCDPMLCLGQKADDTWVAQRPDGIAFPWPQPSREFVAVAGYARMTSMVDGRFGLINTNIRPGLGTVLWDRIGGGTAFVRLTGGETVFAGEHGVYSHQGDDDDPKTVVDLRAIG